MFFLLLPILDRGEGNEGRRKESPQLGNRRPQAPGHPVRASGKQSKALTKNVIAADWFAMTFFIVHIGLTQHFDKL